MADSGVQAPTLIVGLGSAHGDDQAGWEVVRRLAERLEAARTTKHNGPAYHRPAVGGRRLPDLQAPPLDENRLELRAARSPLQVLDWLDGAERLILCDACQGPGSAGQVFHWQWPAAEIQQVRFSGSHDMSLAAVLELATRLRRLPADVVLWAVVAKQCQPATPLSPEVRDALPKLLDAMMMTNDQ